MLRARVLGIHKMVFVQTSRARNFLESLPEANQYRFCGLHVWRDTALREMYISQMLYPVTYASRDFHENSIAMAIPVLGIEQCRD